MTDYEPQQAITGLGCGLVAPTAILGSILLIEDHVPKLQAWAEFFGWSTLCVLVSVLLSSVHKRFRASARFSFLAATIIGGIAFFLLVFAEADPRTPDMLKSVFTSALAVLGIMGPLFLILQAMRAAFRSSRA